MANKFKKKFFIFIIINIFFLIKTEDKKFVIVIPSYNNSLFYKKNIDSAICQKYDQNKFRIVYIDDCSTDNTSQLVEQYISDNKLNNLISLRKNKLRRGAMANLWSEINLCNANEIVVMLDGDDSLKDENVLSYLNTVYADSNVWLTYGQYECDPIEAGIGFAENYSKEIIENRDFRKNFLATHLRTFYAWLFQNIKLEDFIYDDSFLVMTWDLAIMFPILEMSGNKFKFINKILYKYNMNNPLSDFKTDPTLMFYLSDFYKKKAKYALLSEPKFINIKNRFNNPSAIGFIYSIDKILSYGFNINERDFKGRTILIQSIKFGILSLTNFLISKNADVNLPDNDGLTPLMYACIFSDIKIIKLLIENGANFNKVNNFGYNALYYAKKYNKHDIEKYIESLIKNEKIKKDNDEKQNQEEALDENNVMQKKLNKYKKFLENGTYEGQEWSNFKILPKSRYYTFKKAFEHFEKNNGKIIVELGTTRSYVHGGLPGCNNNDTKYWQPQNSEAWDWGAGFFTRMSSECLFHLNPKIYTVDIVSDHIERCKVITEPFKNIINYQISSSLTFLKNYNNPKTIDLLYLDTGDMHPIDPSAFLQLEEAKLIIEKDLMSDKGIILIDDVKNQTPIKYGETSNLGKSKYSIPYFLAHGYKIIEDEYQIILIKK